MKKFKVKVTTTAPLLGSQPGSPLGREWMRERAEEEGIPTQNLNEEARTFEDIEARQMTVFNKVDGRPIFFNHQIKGALKGAANVLNGLNGVKAMRNRVQDTVYIYPRQIPINGTMGEPVWRPLRASTPMGERVTIAGSETVNEGATFEFEIHLHPMPKFEPDKDLIVALLDRCKLMGLGQYRNSGLYGQFEYELTEIE